MNVARIELVAALAVSLFLIGCQSAPAPEAESTPEHARREGATFTFSEVRIDGNGWLVMHPFENGRPNGMIYAGATYLHNGTNENVEITVDSDPAAGDMFLVMLHRDVNENREFDFVFVDERNVVDAAVFEGTKMIAHPIAAP
jgi:hypothetical protein